MGEQGAESVHAHFKRLERIHQGRGVGTTPATPAMAGPILILGIGYGRPKVGGPAAKKGCGFVKHAAESATR